MIRGRHPQSTRVAALRVSAVTRSRGLGLLLALSLALVGCSRDRSPEAGGRRGPEGRGGSDGLAKAAEGVKGWFGQGEVDCPDGLARCSGGVVQASVGARRPLRCTGDPEACACPWTVAGRCDGDCAADGVEVALPQDEAPVQLCAPTPDAPSSWRAVDEPRPGSGSGRSPPGAGVAVGDACEGGGFVCLGSAVVACEPSPEIVASCTSRCAIDSPITAGVVGSLTGRQAAVILCGRSERSVRPR